MAHRTKQRTRVDPANRWRALVVGGVVIGGSIVVDPFGFQAFLLGRLLLVSVAVLVGAVLPWIRGVSLPTSLAVRIGIGGLLGSLLVAAALSRAPMVALFGASGRQVGALAWAMFAVVFIVGLSLYGAGEERPMHRVLVMSVAVSVLWIAVVGAFEVAGHPMVELSQAFGNRLQSTLGNPAVLGAFLTLALPILAAGLIARIRPWLSGSAFVAGLVMVVASGTRGAWIGLVVAALYAVIAVLSGSDRRGRVVIVGAGVAVVAFAAITIVTGRWSTADFAIEGRVDTWGVAVRVIEDHPVFGVGPEGFADTFAETVDDAFVIKYTRDNVVDRAHNGVLDLTLSGGLIALAFYLLLLGAIGVLLYKAAVEARSRDPVSLGMAAAIFAYVVQQQALFQLAALDVVFWLIVGLLASRLGFATDRGRKPVVAGAAIVVAGLSVLYATVGVAADHVTQSALHGATPMETLDGLGTAARLRPLDEINPLLSSTVARQVASPALIEQSLGLLAQGLRWIPGNGSMIMEQSALLVDLYEQTGDQGALDEAERILLDLTGRDRTNGLALMRLGVIRFHRGDLDGAEEYWIEAARLMPHRDEPLDNLAVIAERRG